MVSATALRRHGSIAPTGRGVVLRGFDPALRSGRTIFGGRVTAVADAGRVLKSGHNSRKIGKVITKGKWRGLPIYTLTLEERATCPRDCKAWAACYGNNMNWAERIVAGGDLEAQLERELDQLSALHPAGFAVRLHVLGDFYSMAYVYLWERALERIPGLRIFGFTARHPVADPIGRRLYFLSKRLWDRFAVRFSNRGLPSRGAELLDGESTDAIPCPAQTGATDCCATCGLCWATTRNIGFARH